ncbi:PAS domain S-box protein [Tolypothrix campylonemoides VB511288]|nr:PAS domain S-box protein [Tolypothrix campylonemoides VB511288]
MPNDRPSPDPGRSPAQAPADDATARADGGPLDAVLGQLQDGAFVAERVAGEPVDFRYVFVNAAFARHTGIALPIGGTIREQLPRIEDWILATFVQVLDTGRGARVAARALDRDFDVEAVPAGAPGRIAVLVRDVSSQRAAEAELRRSEALRRLALESGGMGAWQWDTRTRTVRADAAFQRLWDVDFGDRPHPVSVYTERMDADGVAALEAVMARALAAGERIEGGSRVARGATAGRWIQWRGRADADRPWLVNGVSFDVTAQRRAEQAVRDSETRLAKAIDIETVGVVFFDLEGGIHQANDAFLRMIGHTRAELEAGEVRYERLTPPKWRWRDLQTIAELRAAGSSGPFEKEYTRKDGARIWILCNSTRLDAREAVEFVIDVTERKRADIAVRDSEERLRGVLDAMGEGFALLSADFTITDVNRETLRLDGRDRADLVGRSHWDAFPGTERSPVGDLLRRVARERVPGSVQHRYAWPDGRTLWLELRAFPTGTGGVATFWRDISARLRDEAALLDSEARYRALFESMDEAYAVVEVLRDDAGAWHDFRFLEVNPAFMAHTGMPWPVGRTATELLGAPNPRWAQLYGQALDTGLPIRVEEGEAALGRVFDVNVFALDRDANRVAALFTDITARKRTEAALREGQQRQAFLLELSDALRPLTTPAEILATASRLLGERLRASRVMFAEFDAARGIADVFHGWFADGAAPFPSVMRLQDFEGPVLDDLRAGRTVRIDDATAAGPRPDLDGIVALGVHALLSVPLTVGGRLAMTLSVHQHAARRWTDGEVALVEDVAERLWAELIRARAEAALRDREERYRAILASALDYAIFTTDADGRIDSWPPGAEAVFGWRADEILGRDAAITYTPDDRDRGVPRQELDGALADGVAPNVCWHQHKDGRRVFIEGSTRPLRDAGGTLRGFLKVGQDVTARRAWDERQQVLLHELQHRTRNLMGVVRAMFERTRHDSADAGTLASKYADRLAALARVQGLLSRLDEGDRITFDELIRTELSAMGALDAAGRGERVVLDGPAGVRMRSSTVQTFALALHELATNAAKYGALLQPAGRLHVRWRLRGTPAGRRLRIDWTEHGVAMPAPGTAPRGTGYGRELIERALPYQLDADVHYAFGEDGVRCTIELPVSDRTPPLQETPDA